MNRCNCSLPLPIPYKQKDNIRSSTSPKSQPHRETHRLGCRRSVPLALLRLDALPGSTPNCSTACLPLWFCHNRFFTHPIAALKQRPPHTVSCCRRSTSANRGRKASWPYVPYDTVAHPYARCAYDKKALSGYMCNVVADPNFKPYHDCSAACSPLWFCHNRFFTRPIAASKQRPPRTVSCCRCSTSANRGRKASLPYVPYDTMAHPYAP
jgi:hypothetical protein